jgi:hypothetical protein
MFMIAHIENSRPVVNAVQHCYILNARLLRPQFPFPERRRIAKAFTPDCILPRDSKPGRRLDGLRGDTGR